MSRGGRVPRPAVWRQFVRRAGPLPLVLDAIAARAGGIRDRARSDAAAAANGRFNREEARALEVMGLASDTDRQGLRRRYSELVRRYHPDRNGGDRRHEDRLGQVVEAYQLLRKSAALA